MMEAGHSQGMGNLPSEATAQTPRGQWVGFQYARCLTSHRQVLSLPSFSEEETETWEGEGAYEKAQSQQMAEGSACVIQLLSLSCEHIAYPGTSEKKKKKQPFVDEVGVREKQY